MMSPQRRRPTAAAAAARRRRSLSLPVLAVALLLLLPVAASTRSAHAQSASLVEHRTLFHLFPASLASPLATAASTHHQAKDDTLTPAGAVYHLGHANARASSSVHVLTFTRAFDDEEATPPLLLRVPDATNWTELSPAWATHTQLNRLVQLQCGLVLVDYCTDEVAATTEGEERDWEHLKLEQPCVLPIISRSTEAGSPDANGSSMATVAAISVVLFLPPHASVHPSQSHAHAANENHQGFPPAHSAFWSHQCQLGLANEFELDHPEETHLAWTDQQGDFSEEARYFDNFPILESELTGSADTGVTSIWSDAVSPAYFTHVYHQFQVALAGRTAPAVDDVPVDEEDFDLLFEPPRPSRSNSSDEFSSFLETESVIDVMDASSVMAELHAREMADTNDLYRLMGQLTDATRTGASATVVWELIIRPCVNILRKILLQALRQLMAKVLIKGLHALVTSAINPADEVPDESEYTQPPVADVEDPEDLWSSTPPEVPDAIVPPPEAGTDIAGLEVGNSAFLGVKHVVGMRGILDPLLAFLVPVLHNTVTQATHDIAQKGMTKSIQMHSIAPMKEQIHAGVHRTTTQMLTSQLTEMLTEHVSKHLIAQLPRTLTILCAQDVHKALSRPTAFGLSYSLTFALTRSPQQDEECVQCDGESTKCTACEVTKGNDAYVNYYVDYYGKYFENYYSYYYTDYFSKLFANDQLKKSGDDGGADDAGGADDSAGGDDAAGDEGF